MTTFGPLFVPPTLLAAVSGRAWLEGMLEAERALATAEASGPAANGAFKIAQEMLEETEPEGST